MRDALHSQSTTVWHSYPSWRQFAWLYLMSAAVLARALLFRRFDAPGWEAWLAGAGLLLALAPVLRHWARYELTSEHVLMRNGYTGRIIDQRSLRALRAVEVMQGPVAAFLGIGTVVLEAESGPALRLRGLADPEFAKARIDRARTVMGQNDSAAGSLAVG